MFDASGSKLEFVHPFDELRSEQVLVPCQSFAAAIYHALHNTR